MYKRLFAIGAFIIVLMLPMSALEGQDKEPKEEQPKKEQPKEEQPKKEQPKKEGKDTVKPPVVTKPGEPKPYDDVIPKTAKGLPGVFTVHKVDEKIYFEIP